MKIEIEIVEIEMGNENVDISFTCWETLNNKCVLTKCEYLIYTIFSQGKVVSMLTALWARGGCREESCKGAAIISP